MTRYVRSAGVEAAPMLDETILYSPAGKQFCVLNPTAACVWESLVEPQTAEALATRVRERFAVDGTVDVAADIHAALHRFQELQLVAPVEGD